MAQLARLRPTDEQIEQYRSELGAVLEHVSRLAELPLDDVEPQSHPTDIANRLADDNPGESLPVVQLRSIAPDMEQDFIAIPKVLEEGP